MPPAVLYYAGARKEERKTGQELIKNLKILKKVLDKAKRLQYSIKAAAPLDGAESTLKIEQCKKKKLMQISTRKGFLTGAKSFGI